MAQDQRGGGAVEFALVLPLLLLLALGLVDTTNYVLVWLKTQSATATAADLVARTETISRDELQDIAHASQVVVEPLDGSQLKGTIYHVTFDSDSKATVAWQHDIGGGDQTSFSPTSEASDLASAEEGVVIARLTLAFDPISGYLLNGMVDVTETVFASPRLSQTIPCSDC